MMAAGAAIRCAIGWPAITPPRDFKRFLKVEGALKPAFGEDPCRIER
jgi:hypothetical protein